MELPFKIKPQDLSFYDIIDKLEEERHIFFLFHKTPMTVNYRRRVRILPSISRETGKTYKYDHTERRYTALDSNISVTSNLSYPQDVNTLTRLLGEPSSFSEKRENIFRFRYDWITPDPTVVEKIVIEMTKESFREKEEEEGAPFQIIRGKLRDLGFSLPYRRKQVIEFAFDTRIEEPLRPLMKQTTDVVRIIE